MDPATLPAPAGKPVFLACVGRTPRLQAVASEACTIAQRMGAELVFLHVGEDLPEARAECTAAIATAAGPGPAPAFRIAPGKPDEVACEIAAELGAKLIIMGAMGTDAFMQYLVGSVARRVARHAACSVLLLPYPRAEGTQFRTVVASTAFDERSRAMLELAGDLARQEQAVLHVVNELDMYGLESDLRAQDKLGEDSLKLLAQSEKQRLTEFVSQVNLRGVQVRLAFLEGREGRRSVAYAREVGADLLILPAPTDPLGFWDRFFRHPAEVVLQELPCALLLFRQPSASADDPPSAE